MTQLRSTIALPVLSVAIPMGLAYGWGLSWGTSDFPGCTQGTYFLADLGWILQGLLLGLVVGIVVPIMLTWRSSFLLSIPLLVVAGAAMFVAADRGALTGAAHAGCSAWDVRGAGQPPVLGLVVGGTLAVIVIGVALGLRRLFRSPHESTRSSTRN